MTGLPGSRDADPEGPREPRSGTRDDVVRRFVEHWGVMARSWGINSTMGEFFALLYITGTDWTADALIVAHISAPLARGEGGCFTHVNIVIAGDAVRLSGRNHFHDQAEDARRVGSAVDKIAEEDGFAPGGRNNGLRTGGWIGIRLNRIAESREQLDQLVVAAVNVADDVERAGFRFLVVVERLAFEGDGVGLFGRREHQDMAEAFAIETTDRTAQTLQLAMRDVSAQLADPTLQRPVAVAGNLPRPVVIAPAQVTVVNVASEIVEASAPSMAALPGSAPDASMPLN